jgi:hypothetical protein
MGLTKDQKRKAALKKRAQKSNRPRNKRDCGDCTVCCTLFPIKGLPQYEETKPAGEPCKWLLDTPTERCGKYPERPMACQSYECLWIKDGRETKRKLLHSYRPNELGIVFDLTARKHVASKALGGKPCVIAREARAGAFGEIDVLEAFERMLDQGDVIVKIVGKGREKHYEFLARKEEDAQKVAKAYQKIKEFKVSTGREEDRQKIGK